MAKGSNILNFTIIKMLKLINNVKLKYLILFF